MYLSSKQSKISPSRVPHLGRCREVGWAYLDMMWQVTGVTTYQWLTPPYRMAPNLTWTHGIKAKGHCKLQVINSMLYQEAVIHKPLNTGRASSKQQWLWYRGFLELPHPQKKGRSLAPHNHCVSKLYRLHNNKITDYIPTN